MYILMAMICIVSAFQEQACTQEDVVGRFETLYACEQTAYGIELDLLLHSHYTLVWNCSKEEK